MDENTLLTVCLNHINNSTGDWFTEVSEQRASAMEAYYQEPYGNEAEGKSQIVTSEVADTVEWFLPSLMKVFTQGGKIARFTPSSPQDVAAAEQETDAINYMFMKKMDGFDILYSWFKDALLQKNGIVKYYYDDKVEVSKETYGNLTQDEFTALAGDPELEPEEWEMDETTGLIDVTFVRTVDESCPMIEVVPPEEFYINPEYEHLPLTDAPFVCHETQVTASDLIAMGYDKSVIDEIPHSDEDVNLEEERSARFSDIGDYDATDNTGQGDDSMRKIQYAECYIRVDYDDDGVGELRKVCIANRTKILANEEVEEVPFVSITPVPMPHRFFGRSIADQTMDLQLQKTTLLRNIMDNLYLINNQRTIVLEGGANIDDLLISRAGGIVREYTPDAVRPFPTTPFTGHPYEMLEYIDGMKESRTGITKYNQGLDANSLNKTASGMGMIMDASQSRIELVSRLFADGVAKMMVGLHGLMLRNQNKPMIVEIRGRFIPIDPRQWRKRTDMTVNVGLGTSDSEKMAANLQALLGIQQQAMQLGFVRPEHLHNTYARIVETMGLQNVEMFFSNVEDVQPPPPQPDPQMMMVEGQLKTATESNQNTAMKNQADALRDKEKNEIEKAKVKLQAVKIAGDQKINEGDLIRNTVDDINKNAYNLTKLEVDSEQNVPGSKV